jgi:predicted alpha/beta-fold hydrolase
LCGSIALPAYRRERLETPDGDFLDLDWIEKRKLAQATPAPCASGASPDAPTDRNNAPPLVVLFHGLEGSSASHYARALMHAVAERDWHGVVVHFRGCSGEPNRLPRAYHSGDSAEIAWVLEVLSQRYAQLHAVGVSLGGNALLKYLGEQGSQAKPLSAAAVSVPYDLAAANHMLSRGIGRLYSRHFLRSLIPGSVAKAQRFPGHPGYAQLDAARQARTLRDFDAAITAPLHGFRDADNYYARSSSTQYLPGIAVPTLLLHAGNDPFLPASAIPCPEQLPGCVQLEIFARGGHVGFVSGAPPGHLEWLPERLLGHLGQYAGNNRVA